MDLPIRPHSHTGQAAWIDLLRLLQDAALTDLRGAPTLKTVGNRRYWYDRFRIGDRVVDRYLGEDTEALRARIDRSADLRARAKEIEREAARLVRLLRAEGYLAPDLATGQLLAALARAGAFRLGGTLVGTQAFRLYDGLLGVRIGADQAAATDDIDITTFERLSIALGDTADPRLATVFADLAFDPVPSLDPGHVWRWRQTARGTLVEFLTPSFSAEEGLRRLPALGVSAQSLHFLNYLIAEPLPAPVVYRSGVLVQVPRPERYAIHKLIVASRRRDGPMSPKARKDLAQAAFLIAVLAEEAPHALEEAWEDAVGRGLAWREAIGRSLDRLPGTRACLPPMARG